MPEEFEGEGPDNLDEPPSFFPSSSGEGDHDPGSFGELIEVKIQGVFAVKTEVDIQHMVLLTDGDRRLPIIIGPFEAISINNAVEGERPDRPMTHDLMRNLIDRVGCGLRRVVIDDLWNTTYYAKLHLKHGKEEFEIDARPSDAIALAARLDAPIYVADGILEQGSAE